MPYINGYIGNSWSLASLLLPQPIQLPYFPADAILVLGIWILKYLHTDGIKHRDACSSWGQSMVSSILFSY